MSKKSSDTGDPTEYSDGDAAAIEAAVDQAWAEYEAAAAPGEEPTGIRVSARIEWNGSTNRSNNGHRTTTLVNLNLAPVKKALDHARETSQRARQARPAASYRAKGWHAQIRALTESKRGSAAADRAGLEPSSRTLQRWLSGDVTPSKANQAKITEAYGALGTWRVDTAKSAAKAARRALADTLSRQLRNGYPGTEIRFFDIENMGLRD